LALCGTTGSENLMRFVSMRGLRPLVWVGISICVGTCSACMDSPSRPSKPSLPVTGTWSGSYSITSCGATFEVLPCSYFAPTTNTMRLILTQDDVNVTGTFSSDIMTQPLAVTGSIDSTRTLRLQGSQEFLQSHCGGPALKLEIANWTTALDATGSSLTGTFRQSASRYYFSCYWGTIVFQTEIISLRRSPSV